MELPWIIKKKIDDFLNSAYFLRSSLNHNKNTPLITFSLGFHGKTGGSIAITQIARLLSKRFPIEFVSFPASNYNSILHQRIQIVRKISPYSKLVIFDVTAGEHAILAAKKNGKKTLVSCHGFPDSLHSLTEEDVRSVLEASDWVHFVSPIQQSAFKLHESKFFIIKNVHPQVIKRKFGNNVGIIGEIDNPVKNIQRSLDISLKSNATKIHAWSSSTDPNRPVIYHPWTNNKEKIYNSIDVLVSMSQNESFGLIVSEALSAGVPCLLSDIPAFKAFSDCEGVSIVDPGNINAAVDNLNQLLIHKNTLRNICISYWKLNLSEQIIEEQWFSKINKILTSP